MARNCVRTVRGVARLATSALVVALRGGRPLAAQGILTDSSIASAPATVHDLQLAIQHVLDSMRTPGAGIAIVHRDSDRHDDQKR